MLSVLINLYIGECADRDLARFEITRTAEDMIHNAATSGLPTAEQKLARDRAKVLVRTLISGVDAH